MTSGENNASIGEDLKDLSGGEKSLDSPPKGESGEPDIQSFMYYGSKD